MSDTSDGISRRSRPVLRRPSETCPHCGREVECVDCHEGVCSEYDPFADTLGGLVR